MVNKKNEIFTVPVLSIYRTEKWDYDFANSFSTLYFLIFLATIDRLEIK